MGKASSRWEYFVVSPRRGEEVGGRRRWGADALPPWLLRGSVAQVYLQRSLLILIMLASRSSHRFRCTEQIIVERRNSILLFAIPH